ncbi:hypothetical protein PYCCODRAFT_1434544 [Trametes coccinea BRFM310]|uniref:M protein, serotype 2.1 n=1 Tax=Trametes coccinea (strain BRFM310) TaxID=1353009 RepID=A0A1Y2IRC6_TRAC3|nr:hypothetical protein PYCCODRAFT_1434544 [Trametes coccinea BRFM310]
MATAAPARATPASRRSPPALTTSPAASSIAKGATARAAANARASSSVSSPARRASVRASQPPVVNGETRESLSASLKAETEQKEKLLVQLQDKDQTITQLTTDNDNLTSALHAAESRLAELYADQNRMEEEMAARMEVIEKLRTQVRELEKEKRDIQRRYNEQTATFEAERQAFYDNEQHLKSRIQSLTQARKQPPPVLTSPSVVSVAESETDVEEQQPAKETEPPKQDLNDPDQEPAEMTALRLELSTLSTSYSSLQSTLVLLQTQLNDLKRVNNELQEENESYNILLREKTLSGQFDVMRMGGTSSVPTEPSESEAGDDDDGRDAESLRSRTTARSVLDPVDEHPEEHHDLDPNFELQDQDVQDEDSSTRAPRRGGRRRTTSTASRSPAPRGESLANLPITGPGLDLAAELGRAENKDLLEGRASLDTDRSIINPKGKKGRKSETTRKVSSMSDGAVGVESSGGHDDIETLKNEVKSLKDANKALSLYASKIIDRIISQEGFEHVLAVDYDKVASPTTTTLPSFPNTPNPATAQPSKKSRPQSAIFGGSSIPTTSPPQERLTTFDDIRAASAANSPKLNGPPSAAPSTRASRRSLSFDWSKFSMFGGKDEKKPDPHLRPLTLKAGTNSVVTGARKLETEEDEEDRRERERLHATMKLMGIEKPASPAMPAMGKSYSSPVGEVARTPITATTVTPGTGVPPTPSTSSRFSFFRRTNSVTSESGSAHSSLHGSPHPGSATPNLTQEALEQAEAESTLAALDAHERQLSIEIAKGSPGGFTEIVRRSGDRRSSRRSGGSGSTVWSAGMSKGEGEDD